MKKIYPLLFILLGCMLLQSCKKEGGQGRLIPDDMKAYWSFKPGSYWIYSDSVSGNVDSIYVTGCQNNTVGGVLDNYIYEILELDTHSSLDGYDYDYTISTGTYLNGNQGYGVIEYSTKPNTYPATYNCFIYPLTKGFETTQDDGTGNMDTCIVRNIYPNYDNYSNVVEIDNTKDTFEPNYAHSKSFYVKNIGRIRYAVPSSNKVRTLVRYKLN